MVVYTGSSDDEALNAGVNRFAATPDARKYFEHWYEPSGKLTMPVLIFHNALDPVVPYRQLAKYRSVVEAANRSEWLAERIIETFGHCMWDTTEQLAAFQELVTWVKTGVKPEP
jgi:alpha-beta hydrolase superfamily lysophospholipase